MLTPKQIYKNKQNNKNYHYFLNVFPSKNLSFPLCLSLSLSLSLGTPEQVGSEIKATIEFIKQVYSVFGFNFYLNLSTRPEKYVGSESVWNNAEDSLKRTLNELDLPFGVDTGGGAFYGPKIDVTVSIYIHIYLYLAIFLWKKKIYIYMG